MRGKALGSFPRPFLNSDEDDIFQRWMEIFYLVRCVDLIKGGGFKETGEKFLKLEGKCVGE